MDDFVGPDGAGEIEDLFEAYREGFDDFDAGAITDCFAYPVTIWQFGKGNVFVDADDLLENVEKLLDVLDGEGIVESRFVLTEAFANEAGGNARVEWSQMRDDGEDAFAYACLYGLVRDAEGALRIGFVVNE